MSPSKHAEVDAPHRHVDSGFPAGWFAVEVDGAVVVVNEAGEGSVTTYTIGEKTKNPRVIAHADAVLWGGIVGLTHYEDGLVSISHRFGGVEDRLPVDVWLDECVPTLEETTLVKLKGVGGRVEFDCMDCGEHIERERHQLDIPGLTPQRCTSCTFDRMGSQ